MSSYFHTIILHIILIIEIKNQYFSFKIDFQIQPAPLEENKEKIFSHYYEHELMTYLCLGLPNQCFNLKLSFNSYNTWLCTNNKSNPIYYPNLSTSLKQLDSTKLISTSKHITKGNYVKDVIDTEHNENTIIQFYITDNANCSLIGKGELGLGNQDLLYTKNSNDSFIDQLYDNEIISGKVISIKFNNETNGKIILGDSYEVYGEQKYLKIPSIGYSIVTSGNFINKIEITSTLYSSNYPKVKCNIEINKRLVLNFGTSFFIVPKFTFYNISNVTFSSYFKNSICKMKYKEDLQSDWIVCSEHILNTKLDNLVIHLNSGEKIEINLSKLFLSYKNDKLIFAIISRPNLQYFIIGDIFLKRFTIFLDKDKKTMRLYSKNIKVIGTNNNPFGLIIMFIFGLSLILCLWNMADTLCKKKPNKKKYSPKYEKFLQKKNKDVISV